MRGEIIRTIAYVDGFNLYYGSLKNTPHKWAKVIKGANLKFD